MTAGGYMSVARFELRLDSEHREMLEELARLDGTSAAAELRKLIAARYEERVLLARRLEAARRIGEANVEYPPDPEEMSRQLADKYGPLP